MVKRTRAFIRIVAQLMADPDKAWYGYDLMKASRCLSGTLYVNLGRMEEAGWIEGEFEIRGDPDKPMRRVYRVTDLGRVAMATPDG